MRRTSGLVVLLATVIPCLTNAGSWGLDTTVSEIEAIDNWDGIVIWGTGNFMSTNSCGGDTKTVYLQSSHPNYYVLYSLIMDAWARGRSVTPTLTANCGPRNAPIVDGFKIS